MSSSFLCEFVAYYKRWDVIWMWMGLVDVISYVDVDWSASLLFDLSRVL